MTNNFESMGCVADIISHVFLYNLSSTIIYQVKELKIRKHCTFLRSATDVLLGSRMNLRLTQTWRFSRTFSLSACRKDFSARLGLSPGYLRWSILRREFMVAPVGHENSRGTRVWRAGQGWIWRLVPCPEVGQRWPPRINTAAGRAPP